MAVTYAIDALDHFIREELPSDIHESLPEIAPVYKYIHSTSLGVMRKGIGRDWKVIHLYSTGLAGLIQNADPRGATFHDNTLIPSSVVNAGIDVFPAATAAPHSGSLRRDLTLQMTTGNFNIPVTWFSGDALNATQIQMIVRDIKAVGQLRALTEAQSFFMASNNCLCQIDDAVVGDDGSSPPFVTFTVKAGTGRTQFFRRGMMVDILDDSSGTPQFGTDTDGTDVKNYSASGAAYYVPLIVADVDYFSGVITITSVDGTTNMGNFGHDFGTAIEDDDWVVLRGCGAVSGREQKTWGIEDWMKSSGQIMGGSASDQVLDLDTYSQFKSKVTAVNGPLTDTVMNNNIGGFLDAFPGASLDTLLTTMGVTNKYMEQPQLYNNRMFYDRQGKALTVMGGWDDVGYTFNGRKFRWMISPMVIPGRLYGFKLNAGNIKRYIPPKVGGSNDQVGSEVEFMCPLAGHSNIFKVAHASSGASQALLEAPFWQYQLVCPIDVKGVKLTDTTEAATS